MAENLTDLGSVDFPYPLPCLFPIRLGGDPDGAPAGRSPWTSIAPGGYSTGSSRYAFEMSTPRERWTAFPT